MSTYYTTPAHTVSNLCWVMRGYGAAVTFPGANGLFPA